MSAAVASSPGYEKDQELDVAKDVAYSSAQGTSRELFGGVSIAPMVSWRGFRNSRVPLPMVGD